MPTRVKELVESARLHGPRFREAIFLDPESDHLDPQPLPQDSNGRERWWELISDVTLPRVSPQLGLRDYEGNAMRPETPNLGCVRVEDDYVHPQLRYRRSDLDKVMPWDLAFTFEALAAGRPVAGPYDRPLVASRRFYEFCRDNGLKINWVPVRIDPD